MLVAVLPPAQVFLVRALRNVVFIRGAAVGVTETVGATFVLLLPYCLRGGLRLTLGCAMLAREEGPTRDRARLRRRQRREHHRRGGVQLCAGAGAGPHRHPGLCGGVEPGGGVAAGAARSRSQRCGGQRFESSAAVCSPPSLRRWALAWSAVTLLTTRTASPRSCSIPGSGWSPTPTRPTANWSSPSRRGSMTSSRTACRSPPRGTISAWRRPCITRWRSGPRRGGCCWFRAASPARRGRSSSMSVAAVDYVELDPLILALGRRYLPQNLADSGSGSSTRTGGCS